MDVESGVGVRRKIVKKYPADAAGFLSTRDASSMYVPRARFLCRHRGMLRTHLSMRDVKILVTPNFHDIVQVFSVLRASLLDGPMEMFAILFVQVRWSQV